MKIITYLLTYLNLTSCAFTINLTQNILYVGMPLPTPPVVRTLELILSWRLHYQTITSKAYKSLGLLRRIFNDIYCPEARKALYISITRSTLLYCSCLWKPYLLSDIELIEKVQKRATKYILSDYNSDYKLRLTRLKLLPLMYIAI